MIRLIPPWLTAHRAVLLALGALAIAAFVVSASDSEFAYRPDELALSLLISVVVSGAVTYLCAAVVRVPPGSDSWLITALILFFVLPGASDSAAAVTVAVGAAAAACSKYVLAWRRRLVINPAVAGAVVVYALAYAEVGSIAYPVWWVAAEPLLYPMVVIGALLVTALREWRLVAVFLAASLVTVGVLELTEGGQSLQFWYTSSPTFFVAAVMLPEPLTSPTVRVHRTIYGALVGVLMYWQVSIPISDAFTLEFVPEIALLVGSVYAFAVRLFTRTSADRRPRLDLVGPAPAGTESDTSPAEGVKAEGVKAEGVKAEGVKAEGAKSIAANTYELVVDGRVPLDFVPGQWAMLSAPEWSRPLWRSSRRVFSFAEAPGVVPGRFAFTVSGEVSPVKAGLISGSTGRVFLDSSGGDFVLPRHRSDRPIVLLASGIGITPFRSMLRSALAEGRTLDRFALIHVVRSADRMVYQDVLDAAEAAGADVQVIESSSLADGFDPRSLGLALDSTVVLGGAAHYYCSGNPRFVQTTAHAIRRFDPRTRRAFWRVHADAFLGY
ncbi:oxidoreductase [Gordonia insulae]|uniref:NAD(P)H-flavin reductase n=1 Tax=Gordonia insulae TaxID=2420509 RepID=A0A3G8JK11_9ACTN|nr:oxidoreductase [Gordonia insulae]AZG45333.1 NAD(P)H-flavin reductase [Gordonia insulae]